MNADIGTSARPLGEDMLGLGSTVDEVVHNYGDLWQAIATLAVERDAPFWVDEFRTLNRCLDDAIAHAVTAFSRQHDVVESGRHDAAENKRMSSFSIELRNLLGTAKLAFAACKAGRLPQPAATCSILNHSVDGMDSLINGTIDVVHEQHRPSAAERVQLYACTFQPFEQGCLDRSGLGLGLTIAKQFGAENGGRLSVRDLPDIGCVFTVGLPRHTMSN